ncbi:MAG: hypothetical protein KBT02_12195 [Treponema sp.]|nr:hypothetical protein [Candidatus Treponema caballi]
MLNNEKNFYENHKEELRAKYLGKRIVIANEEVKGAYDSDAEAMTEALKTLQPGTFMIKFVTPTDEEAVQRFMSRVYV